MTQNWKKDKEEKYFIYSQHHSFESLNEHIDFFWHLSSMALKLYFWWCHNILVVLINKHWSSFMRKYSTNNVFPLVLLQIWLFCSSEVHLMLCFNQSSFMYPPFTITKIPLKKSFQAIILKVLSLKCSVDLKPCPLVNQLPWHASNLPWRVEDLGLRILEDWHQ